MIQEVKQFFSSTKQGLLGVVSSDPNSKGSTTAAADPTKTYAVALSAGVAAAIVLAYKLFKNKQQQASDKNSTSTPTIATMKDLQELYLKSSNSLSPMTKKQRIGVLLVNLGTPNDATPNSVYKYLQQFLMDGRVIDAKYWFRYLLVNGLIVPFRYKNSTKNYQAIWKSNDFTDGSASPLKYNTELIVKQLRERMAGQDVDADFDLVVEYAMRYQNPSIETGLNKLNHEHHCSHIMILPLFPQYASATVGSIHEECMRVMSKWLYIPSLHFVNSYPTYAPFIRSVIHRIEEALQSNAEEIQSKHGFDHIIVSYHSLPVHHEIKGYKEREDLDFSYYAQCLQTTKCVLQQLVSAPSHLEESKETPGSYAISETEFKPELSKYFAQHVTIQTTFQSHLGKLPWLTPYTTTVLEELALAKKRVLIVCPSFVTDCIETDHELMIEEREEFHLRGGELFVLVQSVNDEATFVEGLYQKIMDYSNVVHK
ncbi:hypothetical protein C9374_001913 [Naegleria lovaniensis]|uniref:Ferrochelatase n=1 Tax=Naegleria lovaniensis TaxID=51637 RepID=A0AA88GVX5_NAELO|nr:uncharacterized protein C9374_001913 [Naegleria lovaniensis]KAG2386878.1 hypothetical protein C9374_001913 [Naegleria lovaniensis]